MGYWDKVTVPVINTELFKEVLNGKSIHVIDGGSSNQLFEPFNRVRQCVDVYMFEPNSEAIIYSAPVRTHRVPAALWSDDNGVVLNIAHRAETSSVYPPNLKVLKKFPDKIGESARRTVNQVNVNSISIDSAVVKGLCSLPDFIKLDIHSAEYEALIGAMEALKNCSGVLVETWHSPIHDGQHLHADVEKILNEQGFLMYGIRLASRWHYKSTIGLNIRERPRLISSESIFFRDEYPQDKVLVALGLLDLFQFTGACVDLIEGLKDSHYFDNDILKRLRNEIIKNNLVEIKFTDKLKGKLRSFLKF